MPSTPLSTGSQTGLNPDQSALVVGVELVGVVVQGVVIGVIVGV